jgi:hypothetical protein
MHVRRNLTGAARRDASIVAPLVRLAIDFDRRGRADTDTVGRIGNTPVTVGMLKAIYELHAGVPFGEWPVPASMTIIDHWRNEWQLPAAESTRRGDLAPLVSKSPTLTDIMRPSTDARASNDTMVDRAESLTVVQLMCADNSCHRTWRAPHARAVQRNSG